MTTTIGANTDAMADRRGGAADRQDEAESCDWVEIGFAVDGTRLFCTQWADEKVVAWRTFGWLLTGNYVIAHTDVNTMELRRVSPERMCQRLVMARVRPYLGADGAPGGVRVWPGEQPRHALSDPLLAGDRAQLREWLDDENARIEREVAEWRAVRAAWREAHGRDPGPRDALGKPTE